MNEIVRLPLGPHQRICFYTRIFCFEKNSLTVPPLNPPPAVMNSESGRCADESHTCLVLRSSTRWLCNPSVVCVPMCDRDGQLGTSLAKRTGRAVMVPAEPTANSFTSVGRVEGYSRAHPVSPYCSTPWRSARHAPGAGVQAPPASGCPRS